MAKSCGSSIDESRVGVHTSRIKPIKMKQTFYEANFVHGRLLLLLLHIKSATVEL